MTSSEPYRPNWVDTLPVAARQAVEAAIVPRRYSQGALIFSRTEAPEGLFIVREGSALFCLDGENGRRLLLRIIRPNELFGETIALDSKVAPISVEACTDLVVSLVPVRALARLRSEHHAIEQALVHVASTNMRALLDLLEELVLMPLRQRTEALLRRLAKDTNGSKDPGLLDITQAELASMLGASRQAVNQVLAEMERRGLIERRFRNIACRAEWASG